MDNTILRYFGGNILKGLTACKEDISEIRLRTGKALSVTAADRYAFLTERGIVTDDPSAAVKISSEDIRRCFEAICRYSVHSCQGQINQGFITVSGGHRAGICGTAVYSPSGKIENVKYICSINFRIAKQIIGAAENIYKRVMRDGLKNILICGAPCSGKTTALRDLCRITGNEYPTALIDERGELAAMNGGICGNDVGYHTDVFSGYSKPDGIITAIRVMSPRMIFCDELGSEADADAIRLAASSGVKSAASVHCSSVSELLQHAAAKKLIDSRIVDYAVFIRQRQITDIYSYENLLTGKRSVQVI